MGKDGLKAIDTITFVGKAEARRRHWLFVACFVVFMLPGLAMPIVSPGVGALVMAGICVGWWSIVIGFCLVNVAAAACVITVDGDGIAVEGPMTHRRIAWREITDLTLGEAATKAIRLTPLKGRSLLLRLELIEDGQELGRLVRTRVLQNEPAPAFADQTYRLANLRTSVFLFGGAGVLMAVLGGWMSLSTPNPVASEATMFCVVAIYAYVAVIELSRFTRITTRELTFGNAAKKWRVPMDEIVRIQVGDRIDLWTEADSFWLPGRLDRPDRLIQHLRAWTHERSVEGPRKKTGPQKFAPGRGFYWECGWMGLFFLGMAVAGAIVCFRDPHPNAAIMGFGCIVMFGLMFSLVLALFVSGCATYIVDDNTLERKALVNSWRFPLEQVERVWLRGQFLTTIRLKTAERVVDIETQSLSDPTGLVRTISDGIHEPAPIKPAVYTLVPAIGAVSAALLVVAFGAVFLPNLAAQCGVATLCLLLSFLCYCQSRRRYETTAEGLICSGWRTKRLIRFAEIRRLELDSVEVKGGTLRRLTLQLASGSETITSQFEDFTQLEAYLRAHVRSDLVLQSGAAVSEIPKLDLTELAKAEPDQQ